MADSKLSREHSLALLHKLANDDGFRSRYEQKPAAALAELGVPHETIVNLKGACLAPTSLADKSHFTRAHAELAKAGMTDSLEFTVPNAKLDFGSTR
ncbi:MAG TPA: NHLP-related RiPP peptide [Rhodanobacteraceae bacterium]|nr:NHLP-related RiPP peptide [Rhodanobacteraceae bacterium]